MTNYYFPPDFEKKMDYFLKTKITRELKEEVQNAIEQKLKNTRYDEKLYQYSLKNTLKNLDIDYSHGQFYYYWLNCYLDDVDVSVYSAEYDHAKNMGLDDKKATRAAEDVRKDLRKWLKENFN